MLHPWQILDYNNLTKNNYSGKLTSLLIYGANVSEVDGLVRELSKFILCLNPTDNMACQQCSACILYKENNHPDYYILSGGEIDEDNKRVTVKTQQVRELISFTYKSNHTSLRKVIYLPQADRLNLNVTNALLKILEEPPSNCYFILQSDGVYGLLPTILSRCFKYQLARPNRQQMVDYLAISHAEIFNEFWVDFFSDTVALPSKLFRDDELKLLIDCLLKPSVDNIFTLTNRLDLKNTGLGLVLEFIIKWLSDLARQKFSGRNIYFTAQEKLLNNLVLRLNITKLFELFDYINFLYKWRDHPLNYKLQLENILFKYQQIYV